MKSKMKSKIATKNLGKTRFQRDVKLKALYAAVLAGVAAFGAPAFAEDNNVILNESEESLNLLKNKPIDTPTLKYLHQNNIMIPQVNANAIPAPDSGYEIKTGSADDFDFEYKSADENGNLTSNYYKILLDETQSLDLSSISATNDRIRWEEVDVTGEDTITVTLPNDVKKYFKHTYIQPSNYTSLSQKYGDDWNKYCNNVVYKDIVSYIDGSAIDNTKDRPDTNINADFVNNDLYSVVVSKEVSGRGGAIKNDATGLAFASSAAMGNINGNFIGNSSNTLVNERYKGAAQGGAIYNYTPDSNLIPKVASIGDITGDFIGNSTNVIFSNSITLDEIKDLIPEEKIPDSLYNGYNGWERGLARGGAIYNNYEGKRKSIIGNIKGNFVANSAVVQGHIGDALGGAIANYSEMGTIEGDFIANNAIVKGNKDGDFYVNGTAQGGAIYSESGTFGNINGNFISNNAVVSAKGDRYTSGSGGSIYVDVWGYAQGGAIYNSNSSIGDIKGDFISNSALVSGVSHNDLNDDIYIRVNVDGSAQGGAIYSESGTFGNINGNFISNNAVVSAKGDRYTSGSGGSIYVDVWGSAQGGAIYSESGTFGNINGNFISNNAVVNSDSGGGSALGGAIYSQDSTFGDINGNFISNNSIGGSASGGAIYSQDSTFGDINGNFISNNSIGGSASGGAIFSGNSTFGNITGDFVNNNAFFGGAIINTLNSEIGNLNGDFIANQSLYGGVVNYGKINSFTGNFVDNYSYLAAGGIYNGGEISNINANFNNNIAGFMGSSVFNVGKVGGINGNFIGNKTIGDPSGILAHAGVDLDSLLDSIESERPELPEEPNEEDILINNVADALLKTAKGLKPSFGGALVNMGGLDFLSVLTLAESSGIGNAPLDSNTVSIGDINGNFIGNSADGNVSYGGAIANISIPGGFGPVVHALLSGSGLEEAAELAKSNPLDISIGNINGDFINNTASSGGAIANFKKHDETAAPLVNLLAGLLSSGSITSINRESTVSIGDISGNFIGNKAVVSNFDKLQDALDSINAATSSGKEMLEKMLIGGNELGINSFEDVDEMLAAGKPEDMTEEDWEQVQEMLVSMQLIGKALDVTTIIDKDMKDSLAKGGAILNYDGKIKSITNSSFINNIASANVDDIDAAGGAIYTNTDLKIIAQDDYVSVFEGNKIQDSKRGTRPEAIYVQDAELTLETKNNGKFIFNDEINGKNYKLNIAGDNTGVIALNNNVQDAEIKLSDTIVNVTDAQYLNNNNSLNMASGTLNINHFGITPLHFNDIALSGGEINFNNIDVDLANNKMGQITADSYSNVSENAKINVNGFNLLSDAKNTQTELLFVDQNLMNNVNSSVTDLPGDTQDWVAYTPIYKYNVNYDKKDDGGFFVFNRGGRNSANPSESFNPAVLASSVAAQSGALSVATQTFNFAFQNADNFMNIPYLERLAIKNANKYALTELGGLSGMGNYSPIFTKNDSSTVWVKPYASFENVPLKNGPKVSNITYGTLVGFDTEIESIKNEWDRVWTGYIGYNGASQRYSGVDSTQNGGLLGGTLTLYRGNFFNATTISAGANVGSNQTMYGHENMTMLLAGIGNKTGYNFEFKEGKIIFQPSLMMSYTFVNTFDYRNAAGVKINSDPLHAIQIAPGMKIIGNTKNGWQPYIGVNMIWSLLDKSHATANDVKLPEISIKPYVQYGLGIQKRFKDRCMAFGQAMFQSGGRNGISLTAGFRWTLGKEGKPIDKVNVPSPSKKIGAKVQPSQLQSHEIVELSQASTKTVLKQLSQQQKIGFQNKKLHTTRTSQAAVIKQL